MQTTPRTISEVIDHCKEKYFKPAIYVGDTKVGGERTWRATWHALKPFEKHFGSKLIQEITHEDRHEYREERLQTPALTKRVRYTKKGRKGRVEYYDYKQRTIASVDRELAWARRVFKIAKSKKWIRENPFEEGDP